MNKQTIPYQKRHNRKVFSYHTPKCRYLRNVGWHDRRLFSQHPDQLEKNILNRRQCQSLFWLSSKNHASSLSPREWERRELGTLVSAHLLVGLNMAHRSTESLIHSQKR